MRKRAERALHRKRFVKKAWRYTKASQAKISERLGASERQVRRIIEEAGVKRKYQLKTGSKQPSRRRLNPNEKAAIRALREKNLSEAEIAKIMGITQPAVHYQLKPRNNKK